MSSNKQLQKPIFPTNGNRDLGKYKVAPDGISLTMKPEEVAKQLVMYKVEKRPSFTEFPDEIDKLAVLKAAIATYQPAILLGGPGGGKTTSVIALAYDLGVPLVTRMGSEGLRDYDLNGFHRDIGDLVFYDDRELSRCARSEIKCILYIDEAFEIMRGVFTAISEAIDNRRQITLSTGEVLSTKKVGIIAASNEPTRENKDMLPTVATMDRFIVIPYPRRTGDQVLEIFRQKYAGNDNVTAMLEKHGENLKILYDELNGDVFRNEHKKILYGEVTPRSFEQALLLISAGLDPQTAARVSMINGLAPIEDERIADFRNATNRMVDAKNW